jgi:hypothetical protein
VASTEFLHKNAPGIFMNPLKESSDKEVSGVESEQGGFLIGIHVDSGLISSLHLFVKIVLLIIHDHKRYHIDYSSISIPFLNISPFFSMNNLMSFNK